MLDGNDTNLKPLPGYPAPATPASAPAMTGGRPPEADPGNPCPAGAPSKAFAVSAADVKSNTFNNGVRSAFVPTGLAEATKRGTYTPEPLVLHVAAGDCVTVTLKNERASGRVSFHADGLLRPPSSSGVNLGYTPEQTVAVGQTRTYRLYADTPKIGAALIANYGSDEGKTDGLYGAIVVSEKGAYFTNPVNGAPVTVGTKVDVHYPMPGGVVKSYRDFTLLFAEHDPSLGQDHMPYPTELKNGAFVNYQTAPVGDDTYGFSSAYGDPKTPILKAYVGDEVVVHAVIAAGTEQAHTFNLGGQSFDLDHNVTNSTLLSTIGLGPMEKFDATLKAGGSGLQPGDYFYGDAASPDGAGRLVGPDARHVGRRLPDPPARRPNLPRRLTNRMTRRRAGAARLRNPTSPHEAQDPPHPPHPLARCCWQCPASASAAASVKRFPTGAKVGSISASAKRTHEDRLGQGQPRAQGPEGQLARGCAGVADLRRPVAVRLVQAGQVQGQDRQDAQDHDNHQGAGGHLQGEATRRRLGARVEDDGRRCDLGARPDVAPQGLGEERPPAARAGASGRSGRRRGTRPGRAAPRAPRAPAVRATTPTAAR